MLHRREFIAGTLAMGVSAHPPQSALAAPSATCGMTLGFSTYGMKNLTTERSIDLVANQGFDSIELTIRAPWDADPATLGPRRRAELRKRLRARELRLTSLMEHLHIDAADRTPAERIDRLKLAAELAHDLSPGDPPLLQTTIAGPGRWSLWRDRYVDELARWLRVANAEGLVIAVKPHRGGAFSRPEEAAELIELLDKPRRLRMCYDYSHFDFRDMSLEATIRTSLPYVAHVAVKDIVKRDSTTQFVLAGEGGRIDYARLLRLFHDGGYRGDICCEVSGQVWSQAGYDPVKAADTCYRNLAAAFEQAGLPRA